MNFRIVVLIKQVPDTTAVTVQAMKADGTLNRSALPAVFNPEDLNALEMALEIRQRYGGSVCAITMGPPSAAAILREALYRGADRVLLVTDRTFAAADTLATSYVLSRAVRSVGNADIVLCGRQAIDGNTAQVGPQVAEKLNMNQLTYVETIEALAAGRITVRRSVEEGSERVQATLPVLLTVTGAANVPRPPSVKKIMRYKKARTVQELAGEESAENLTARGLLIETLHAADLDVDTAMCGLAGSPTRVKKIESVVLKGKSFVRVEPTESGIRDLLHELIRDYTFD